MKSGFKNLLKINFTVYVLSLILVSIIFLNPSESHAQERENSFKEQLDEAERQYKTGNWQQAVNLTKECFEVKNINENQKAEAFRLLSMIYIATEMNEEASIEVKNLLLFNPRYKVDPDNDPPQLKNMIDSVSHKIQPAITSISPTTIDVKSNPINVTIMGSDFVFGSTVRFNERAIQTTYINQNELKALIPESDLINDGEYNISVFSPILTGKESNSVIFSVEKPSNILTWILVGGGVAVAAIVTIIALGGQDEEAEVTPTSGTFPSPPSRQ